MAYTDVTPKQAEPMQATMQATKQATKQATIVTSQPTSQPAPMAHLDRDQSDEASMRGGATTCGVNCCHGHCSLYKSCC